MQMYARLSTLECQKTFVSCHRQYSLHNRGLETADSAREQYSRVVTRWDSPCCLEKARYTQKHAIAELPLTTENSLIPA